MRPSYFQLVHAGHTCSLAEGYVPALLVYVYPTTLAIAQKSAVHHATHTGAVDALRRDTIYTRDWLLSWRQRQHRSPCRSPTPSLALRLKRECPMGNTIEVTALNRGRNGGTASAENPRTPRGRQSASFPSSRAAAPTNVLLPRAG